MAVVAFVLYYLLWTYSMVLVARIILDWIRAYNPSWRPSRPIFIAAGVIYALTDWLLKLTRRLIPPVRIGPIALDFGILIVFILIGTLQNLVDLFLR